MNRIEDDDKSSSSGASSGSNSGSSSPSSSPSSPAESGGAASPSATESKNAADEGENGDVSMDEDMDGDDAENENDEDEEGDDASESKPEEATLTKEERVALLKEEEAVFQHQRDLQSKSLEAVKQNLAADTDWAKKSTAEKKMAFLMAQSDVFTSFLMGGSSALGKEMAKSKTAAKDKSNSRRNKSSSKSELEDAEAVAEMDESRFTRITQQPNCIKFGTMKPYQLEGLNWMIRLHDSGVNGILADLNSQAGYPNRFRVYRLNRSAKLSRQIDSHTTHTHKPDHTTQHNTTTTTTHNTHPPSSTPHTSHFRHSTHQKRLRANPSLEKAARHRRQDTNATPNVPCATHETPSDVHNTLSKAKSEKRKRKANN
ncbi:hypothetical protein FI667_g17693, partial [Globisporangium splendens]